MKCVQCGKPCYSKCGKCDVALHIFQKKKNLAEIDCFINHHNDVYFGLGMCDCETAEQKKISTTWYRKKSTSETTHPFDYEEEMN